MQRQGQMAEDGTPAARRPEPAETRRARPTPGSQTRRTSPRQFLHEVNVELRKVAWPSRADTANYSIVVFVALAVLMALIFTLDLAFSHLANFLFK